MRINLKKLSFSQQLGGSGDGFGHPAMRDLQHTIDPRNHLPHRSLCRCRLCLQPVNVASVDPDEAAMHPRGVEGKHFYRRILEALTCSGARSLRLFMPDLFFVQNDHLEIYQTGRGDGRVVKLSGAIHIKQLYATLVRMRREYKSQLEERHNRKMYEGVDPGFMHTKYFDKIVPPYFNAGLDSSLLERNKNNFCRYVLHNNRNYEIQGIEEHKMNDREPFCLVVYRDGNCQLLNQLELQVYSFQSLSKIQEQVLYFQSYIKYKKEMESILYSQFNCTAGEVDVQLDRRAQTEVMILLGGLCKYDEGYTDLQSLQQLSFQLMLSDPRQYAELMLYKMVHYLAMAGRMYVTHLKLKWIVNDIGTVYLQEVMECTTTEVPRRIVKFKLGRIDEAPDFYTNETHNFVQIYRDMKRRRALNTLIIKRDVDGRNYEELLEIMNPEMKRDYDDRKDLQGEEGKPDERGKGVEKSGQSGRKSKKVQLGLYKTLQIPRRQGLGRVLPKRVKPTNASTYEQHLREHPQIAMRNMRYDSASLNRYAPERSERVDNKINNHFIFHMSSEDQKVMCGQHRRSGSERSGEGSIGQYLQKRKDRIEKSVLYSTFNDLSHERMREMGSLLQRERVRGVGGG